MYEVVFGGTCILVEFVQCSIDSPYVLRCLDLVDFVDVLGLSWARVVLGVIGRYRSDRAEMSKIL